MWHSKEQLKTGKSGRDCEELEIITCFSADYLKKKKRPVDDFPWPLNGGGGAVAVLHQGLPLIPSGRNRSSLVATLVGKRP